MNELLKHIGYIYQVQRGIVSIPDDFNAVHNTNFAYHMQCRIGIAEETKSMYLMNDQTWLNFLWRCEMSYLGKSQ